MRTPSTFRPDWTKRANAAVGSLLFGFSVYGVPVAVALISVVALSNWESEYATGDELTLEFSVLEDKSAVLTPGEALAQVNANPVAAYHDTLRSEAPFWFKFSTLPMPAEVHAAIELPSRHARETSCWNAADLSPLGSADWKRTSGWIERAKAGASIRLDNARVSQTLLCRATFSGPARISLKQWRSSDLEASIQKFHRSSGLLDGGLILLSAFVLITAVINREWTYVVFAVWLLANLRLAANSDGCATQWRDHSVPESWIYPMRKLTAVAYYVTTITLFSRLFRDDLKNVGYTLLLRLDQWSCVPLFLVAILVPISWWLLWLWASAAFTVVVLVFFLIRIIFITRSTVAMLYAASFGMTLLASLYEVLAAALGLKGLIGSVNFETAALSSALLAALAIAEQMRQERVERLKAQTELRSTYDAIPIGLFTLDAQGVFLRGNPALQNMLGVDLSRAENETWAEHFQPGAWARLEELVWRKTSEELELRDSATEEEQSRRFLVKATLAGDMIEGSLQDITQRAKATDRLRFLSENDSLTGALNRHGIEEAFAEGMLGFAKGQPRAVAYLDLDRFKLINDLFGHLAGDEVLKQVCDRVREMLAEGHHIGRVGGDEFVLVFRNTPIRTATAICRGIVEWIGASPYQIGDKAFQVKGSIGLIEVAADTNVKDAISTADRACREAKKGLHANLVVYEKNETVFKERQEELRLIERLGTGVVPEGLFLVMQPIMSLRAPYESLNFEILLRMRERDNSITSAGRIISAGENNGRSAVIDRWVMSNTLEWLDQHYDALDRTRFACMNLSGASLNDERFIHDAFSMLAQHGRAVGKLCIEITESVALHDLDNTRRFIDKARDFGAKVALDDFGAGYTSFSYLKELRADTLKIDGSFILGVNMHPANLAIVEAIVELARNLGMKSVAEWTEDLATIEALAEVGVDYVQGFIIARPQLPDKILSARSSASFIEDEKTALYVRNHLAKGQAVELREQLRGMKPRGQNS